MPDRPVDPAFVVEYRGAWVGFCCDECLAKFKESPEQYAAAITEPPRPLPALDSIEPVSLEPLSGGARLVNWLGRLHPAAVHLPIGLLIGAALAELLRVTTGRPQFTAARQFCLWCGTIGAVAAALLGWCLGGWSLVDGRTLMTLHRWAGTGTALIFPFVLVLSRWFQSAGTRTAQLAFHAALIAGTLALLASGYLGGALVWGLDHYAF